MRVPAIVRGVSATAILFASLAAQTDIRAQAPALVSVEPPASFIANRGQWNAEVAFLHQKGPLTAWLGSRSWTLVLEEPVKEQPRVQPNDALPNPLAAATDPDRVQGVVLRMTFEGAMRTVPAGEGKLPGVRNYLLGNDPSAWVRDVPAFRSLRYESLWPGVNVVVREGPGLLAYDLLCAPGANAGQAVIRCEGADRLEIGPEGVLLVHTSLGILRQSRPVSWQEVEGARMPVQSSFRLIDETRFGFSVGPMDPAKPLVIDPDLRWSTYFGGNLESRFHGVARNQLGMVFVAGVSDSANYPTTTGVFQRTLAGFRDVVVTCLDPAQSGQNQLKWSTYYGGSGEDLAMGMDLHAGGFVAVAGYTFSTDLPLAAGSAGLGAAAFAAVLTPGGANIHYSRYLSGDGNDWACALVLQPSLGMTVGGYTASALNFPVTANAHRTTLLGISDAFVTRIDGAGTVTYCTFLGGSAQEGPNPNMSWTNAPINGRVLGLAEDSTGRVAVTGVTFSSNFPVSPSCFQSTLAGFADTFVTLLDPTQPSAFQIVWSTFFGGSAGNEGGMAVAVEPTSNTITVGGWTYSPSFPTTPGAYSRTFVGQATFNDAFLARLDRHQTGSQQLVYSTFLNGTEYESVTGISVDGRGFVTAAGFCGPAFPTTPGAFQRVSTSAPGTQDCWVAKLRMAGQGQSDLIYATLVGGSLGENANCVAPDGFGGVIFAGQTRSVDFPMRGTPYMPTLPGIPSGVVGWLDLLPDNVARNLTGSGPHCNGPIIFEVDRKPVAGATFAFLTGHAPLAAAGALVLGTAWPCVPIAGAQLCVNPILILPVAADSRGAFALTIPTAAAWQGIRFGAQMVFVNNVTCTGSWPLSSSPALDVQL